MRLTILHTNDIHGREDAIARIATLVRGEKERSSHQVLYLDAGDVEETTNRLSNLTKGTAMHRLLSQTTCDAAAVGNACWLRYGPGILEEHARASTYPQLLANFARVRGPVPSVLLGPVGVFGLTAGLQHFVGSIDPGFEWLDVRETALAQAGALREAGAGFVVCLSHLGLADPDEPWDDRRLAPELRGLVDVIVGAHTHDLLPEGEWIGGVLVTQAGSFGEYLGRIEVDGGSVVASVEAVGDKVEPWPSVAVEAARIAAEVAENLAEEIAVLHEPLDARAIAEILRLRMDADIGLFPEGQTLAVLPAGPVTRGALWEASESAANPGVTRMTGAQLLDLLRRGADEAFMAETPRPLRGRARGRLQSSGLEPDELDPERTYAVAATDFELEPYGGYALAEWGLDVRYDFPTIVREAVEEHLGRPR